MFNQGPYISNPEFKVFKVIPIQNSKFFKLQKVSEKPLLDGKI